MAIQHFYSQTVADGTATSVVRPSDWNSGHKEVLNLGGNTLGTSQVTGSDIVWAGGNNITLSANGSTVTIVGPVTVAQTNQTAASGNIAGVGTTFGGTNVSGSMTLNSNGLALSLSAAAPGGGGAYTRNVFMPDTPIVVSTTYTQFSTAALFVRAYECPNYVLANRLALGLGYGYLAASSTKAISGGISGVINSSGTASAGGTVSAYFFSRVDTNKTAASNSSIVTYMTASASVGMGITYSQSGSTAGSSGTATLSTTMGLSYITSINSTGGVTTASSTFSGSTTYSSTSTNASSFTTAHAFTGISSLYAAGNKIFNIPLAGTVMTPGEYWIGIATTSSSGANGLNYSAQLFTNFPLEMYVGGGLMPMSPFGFSSNKILSNDVYPAGFLASNLSSITTTNFAIANLHTSLGISYPMLTIYGYTW